MRIVCSLLSLGALLSICAVQTATSTHADHTAGGMNAMSIDMNEEATPANTDSALGTREICGRINENNTLDADEDVIDGLFIDITAEGVPPYHDSGTPSDVSDDTGGIRVFNLRFGYSVANLTIQAESIFPPPLVPGLHMLQRNPSSNLGSLSDLTPDNNSAGDDWFGSGADYTLSIPEDGSGVLERLTLISEGGAATANYPLTLVGGYLDGSFSSYDINRVDNAFVAVNSVCNVDGDPIPDDQDACPQLPGPPSNNGCPPPGPPAVGGSAGLTDNSPTETRWPGQYLVGITVVVGFALAIAFGVRFRTRGR